MSTTQDGRPILTLAELRNFDPQAPANRCWCPLCGEDKPRDAAHRCLSFDVTNGHWKCFRCGAGGTLREFWREKTSGEFAGNGKIFGSGRAARQLLLFRHALFPRRKYLQTKRWCALKVQHRSKTRRGARNGKRALPLMARRARLIWSSVELTLRSRSGLACVFAMIGTRVQLCTNRTAKSGARWRL